MNPMRFELHSASGGYRVHFTDAKNGKVIFWTQEYKNVQDANYAVSLAKKWAGNAPYVDRRATAHAS
jgi:uncharacterized protein YegP (UPF0339 family)